MSQVQIWIRGKTFRQIDAVPSKPDPQDRFLSHSITKFRNQEMCTALTFEPASYIQTRVHEVHELFISQ